MFQDFNIKNKGFTLLEMLIAVFVITVGIIGAAALFVRVTASALVASDRLTAAYLAKEGIEIVRNIRDTNWLNNEFWDEGLYPNCTGGCEGDYTMTENLDSWQGRFLNIDVQEFYSYRGSDRPTKFQRKISIEKPTDDILKILVEINWTEKRSPYSLSVREEIYRWWQ